MGLHYMATPMETPPMCTGLLMRWEMFAEGPILSPKVILTLTSATLPLATLTGEPV